MSPKAPSEGSGSHAQDPVRQPDRRTGRPPHESRRLVPESPKSILRHVGEPGDSVTTSYARVPLDADRLRHLRLRKGWSQHALSVRIGVQGAAAISAWERGVAVPRPSTLRRVAEALGVEPTELLAVDNAEGLALRELRVSRGMSLKELAEAANASSSTVRRWESGDFRRMPAGDVVRALARALDVPAPRVEMALVLARRMAQGA